MVYPTPTTTTELRNLTRFWRKKEVAKPAGSCSPVREKVTCQEVSGATKQTDDDRVAVLSVPESGGFDLIDSQRVLKFCRGLAPASFFSASTSSTRR